MHFVEGGASKKKGEEGEPAVNQVHVVQCWQVCIAQ